MNWQALDWDIWNGFKNKPQKITHHKNGTTTAIWYIEAGWSANFLSMFSLKDKIDQSLAKFIDGGVKAPEFGKPYLYVRYGEGVDDVCRNS